MFFVVKNVAIKIENSSISTTAYLLSFFQEVGLVYM